MPTIIDASAMVAFLAQDAEDQAELDSAVGAALQEGAAVPRWIELEVANALRRFVQDGRLSPAARDALLTELQALPLHREARVDVMRVAALADTHRISVYDAVYLWLAVQTAGSLLTRDSGQARAAKEAGIPLARPS